MLNKKFSGELRVQRRSHRPDGRGTLVQRLHVLLHLGDGGGDEVAVGVRDEVRHEPSHADVVDALADAGLGHAGIAAEVQHAAEVLVPDGVLRADICYFLAILTGMR